MTRSDHWNLDGVLFSKCHGRGIAGVGVARDAQAGIGCQHSLEPARGLWRTVSDNDLAGVDAVADAHAGQVVVADGTPEAARRIERVLTYDPGTAILRHADAGYPEAIAAAQRHGVKVPTLESLKH